MKPFRNDNISLKWSCPTRKKITLTGRTSETERKLKQLSTSVTNVDDKQHSEDEGTGMINDQTSPSCVGNSIEERFDEMNAQIRSLETILEARLYANFDIISNDLNVLRSLL